MSFMRLAVPVASAFMAIGLFVLFRVLSRTPASHQAETGDEAAKQLQMLRSEVYKGQTDVLQALETMRQQLEKLRQETAKAPLAPASPSPAPIVAAVVAPTVAPAPPQLPPPVPPQPMAIGTLAPASGPVWDSKVRDVEAKSEKQYWYQRQEKNAAIHPAFIKYNSNWPCLWGEEYTGQGSGDGNKWTCGARLITKPCVIYSFGSNNDLKFEMGIHGLGLGCEVHIYDPTTNEPRDARLIGAKFHKMGLGGRDGMQGQFPVRTLSTLMKENGHNHIDILKVDIEDSEHQAVPQIASEGWPSIGQLLIEVHIRNHANDNHLDKLFQLIERGNLRLFHQEVNWQYGASCCTEYAFIHKAWRPEVKKYDMKTASTYQDLPLRAARGQR